MSTILAARTTSLLVPLHVPVDDGAVLPDKSSPDLGVGREQRGEQQRLGALGRYAEE